MMSAPAADARVEQHWQPVGGRHHGRQAVQCRQAAVIGAVDAVHPTVFGAARIVGVTDALDDQR